MDLVLSRPADRDELIYGAARGDEFALAMLCVVSNALAEIRACGGITCLSCRKHLGSRAARQGTFAIGQWEDACGYRLFCARCASQQADELLDQAGQSLLAQLRFELYGAGAVDAVGHA
jgi:hypothetical protein